MNIGSLFSGIGGLDLGLEQAGHTVMWQCEKDKAARTVLREHWPKIRCYEDVHDVKGNVQPIDLLAGGFPCQDVSVAGKRKGLAGARSGLWFEFERILGELGPEWTLIENVPGLLTSNGGRDFAVVLRGLGQLGYRSAWRVLDSQYFGVPQRRRRLFVVGHRGDGRAAEILFDEAGGGRHPEKGNREGLDASNYPPLDVSFWNGRAIGQTLDTVIAKKQAMPEKNRFPALVVPAWVPCPVCDDFWCALHGMHADNCPCPPAQDWADAGLLPFNPSVLRFITPLEAERAQGFSDDWTAGQSDTQRYKQLGNAVTVPVAKWIGKRLR